jgi:hypothetical protein
MRLRHWIANTLGSYIKIKETEGAPAARAVSASLT